MPTAYMNATEAVAVFQTETALQAAIDALESNGFDRADIGIMASAKTVEARLGHVYRSVKELEEDARVPTTAFVSREERGDAEGALIGGLMYLPAMAGGLAVVASGGAIAAAAAAAVIAAAIGAGIGAALGRILEKRHADAIEAAVARGGLLLFVRTRDGEHERTATEVLTKAGGTDVHIHSVPSFAPAATG